MVKRNRRWMLTWRGKISVIDFFDLSIQSDFTKVCSDRTWTNCRGVVDECKVTAKTWLNANCPRSPPRVRTRLHRLNMFPRRTVSVKPADGFKPFHWATVCGNNASVNIKMHQQRQGRKRPLASNHGFNIASFKILFKHLCLPRSLRESMYLQFWVVSTWLNALTVSCSG